MLFVEVFMRIALSFLPFLMLGLLFSLPVSAKGDPKAGEALYQKKCLQCHGDTGKGDPEKVPRIDGQHSWYTVLQLKNFQSQARKPLDSSQSKEKLSALSGLSEQDFE